MAKGQREALELAEAARDPLEDRGSFAQQPFFVGRYDFDRIHPYPRRARKIGPQAKIFYASSKLICANTSIPTRSIAPAKFHRKISRDWRRSARLESTYPGNTAGLVCHNTIMGARRFYWGVGTEMSPHLFLRINQSVSRNHCFCLVPKSRTKISAARRGRGEFLHFALTEVHAGSDRHAEFKGRAKCGRLRVCA